jgi:hypothetical protein
MEQLRKDNPTTEFACEGCRKAMVDERIMHHPTTRGYVEK